MMQLKNIVMVVCLVDLVLAVPPGHFAGLFNNCDKDANVGDICDKLFGGQGVCQTPGNCNKNCQLKCMDAQECSDDTLPVDPDFGMWQHVGDSQLNTLAYLICEEGYYVDGGFGAIQCQTNGVWSSSSATCTPINCGPSPSDDFCLTLNVMGEFFVGSTATIVCQNGFGPDYDNATCTTDGTWDIPSDACTVAVC